MQNTSLTPFNRPFQALPEAHHSIETVLLATVYLTLPIPRIQGLSIPDRPLAITDRTSATTARARSARCSLVIVEGIAVSIPLHVVPAVVAVVSPSGPVIS